MPFSKAYIQNYDSDDKEIISVMFNPTEYTSSTSLVLTNDDDKDPQFGMLSSPSFTVTLLFDSYEKIGSQADVRFYTNKLAALQKPTIGTGPRRKPPRCVFRWDTFGYRGVITKLERRFTMFREDGTPVRAEVSVTFEEVLTDAELKVRRGEDNCRKLHVVRQNERLDLIAFAQLGDASKWRLIADLNAIDDPIRFPSAIDVGRTLVIPDDHE